jgi:hypothetical protein
MKKALGIKVLVLTAIFAVVCMAGISCAAETPNAKQVTETALAHQHNDNDGCAKSEAVKVPAEPLCSHEAAGLAVSTTGVPILYAQIPEPQCVCAGCGRKCGSGHTSTCPYRPR